MFRARWMEGWEEDPRLSHNRLQEALNSKGYGNKTKWRGWIQQAFATNLVACEDSCRNLGITRENTLDAIGWYKAEGEEKKKKTLKKFQSNVSHRLTRIQQQDWSHRIRDKAIRWNLPIPPRMIADHLTNNLRYLHDKTAPRVWAATLSAFWNRWTTARRYQKRHLPENQCRLGCKTCINNPEDSLEHYFHCRIAQTIGGKYLKLYDMGQTRINKILQAHKYTDQDECILWGILTYAIYIASNKARAEGIWYTEKQGQEALKQGIRRAVMGHQYSSKLLRSLFIA